MFLPRISGKGVYRVTQDPTYQQSISASGFLPVRHAAPDTTVSPSHPVLAAWAKPVLAEDYSFVGHTATSGSGNGSADEGAETFVLKDSYFGSRPIAAAAPNTNDTVCLNPQSSQTKRLTHRPLQSALRGPRRIGRFMPSKLYTALMLIKLRCWNPRLGFLGSESPTAWLHEENQWMKINMHLQPWAGKWCNEGLRFGTVV